MEEAKPTKFEESEQIGDQLFEKGCLLEAVEVYKRMIEQGYKVDFEIQGIGFYDHCDRRYEWFPYRWYDSQRKNRRFRGNAFDALSLCLGLIKWKHEETINKSVLWYEDMLAKRDDFELYVGYANILNNVGRYEEAFKYYNKVLSLRPRFVNALVAKAMIYEFSRVEKPKAIMNAKSVLEIDPDNMYARFILAKNEKDVDARINGLIENYKKWPEYVRNTNEVGLGFGAKKDSKEAIVWYKKCLEIAPQNAQTYNNVGYRLSVLKEYEESLEWFFKACERDHKYKQCLINAIETFKALGYSSNDILQEMPKYPNLDHFYFYYYLGLAYFEKKEIDAALEWYKRAEVLNEESFALLNSMGLAYDEKKDYESSIKCYHKCIELNPTYHYAPYNMGLVEKRRGNIDQAIEWYKKAIEVNRRYHPPYNNLGNIYKDRKEYDKAIDCYQECVQIHSTYTLVFANLGICLLNQERYHDAFNAFARAKELLPTDNNGLSEANKSFLKEHLDKFDKEGEKWRKTSSISYDERQNLRHLIQSYEANFKQALSTATAPVSDEKALRPELLQVLSLIQEDRFELKNIVQIFSWVRRLCEKDNQYFQVIPQVFIQHFLKSHYEHGRSIVEVEAALASVAKQLLGPESTGPTEDIEEEVQSRIVKLGFASAPSFDLFKQASFFDSYEALYAEIERINKLAAEHLREFTELVEGIRVRSNGKANRVHMPLPKKAELEFPTMTRIIGSILSQEITQEWKEGFITKIGEAVLKEARPTQLGVIHEVIDLWINEITTILKKRFADQVETKCSVPDFIKGTIFFDNLKDLLLAIEACDNICRLRGYTILSLQNRIGKGEGEVTLTIEVGEAVCELQLGVGQGEGREVERWLGYIARSPLGCIFGSYLFMSKGFNYPLLANCRDVDSRLSGSPKQAELRAAAAARYLISQLETTATSE